MVYKLAKRTVDFFGEKQIIGEDEADAYVYGMELLYSLLFNMILAGCIAILTGMLVPIVAFLITFIGLRQCIGGYHAKTHLGCMTIFAVVLLIFSVLARWIAIPSEPWVCVMAVILSILLVCKFAPVEHPNKPLSPDEKARLKKRGLGMVLVVSALILVMIPLAVVRRYGLYLSLGQLTATLAMLCEVLKNKRDVI